MEAIKDEEILELLGNAKTFEKGFRVLMQAYQERVYWHIRRMVTDHDDASDVVQNTFVKAFRGLKNFKGQSKLYTWLYRIATNESLTFLSKRKKQATQAIDNGTIDLSERLEADQYFDGDAAQKKLMQAMETLPDKQKAVFSMRYFDDMPYKEMSVVLETSVGGLKASYHHAVKKIEQHLVKSTV